MRVVICGVGQVGHHIAGYLARENNDVTVVDIDRRLVDRVSDDLDVNGIVGHASKPDVLDRAGTADADLFIAVTHSDEVNMVACQVAHSLFNVPKKIARIRDRSYLDPAWFNLFSRSQMPIDVIISPELSVAESLAERLSVPGTTNVIELGDGHVFMLGVLCLRDCPVVNTTLSQLDSLFPDLRFTVGYVFRAGNSFIPSEMDQLMIGDEACLIVERDHISRVLSIFGHEESEARHLTLVGGGNIGRSLAEILLKKYGHRSQLKLQIIEQDRGRAVELSEHFGDSLLVMNGDCLDRELLRQADVASSDTTVMITDNDEINILGALLMKQEGCSSVVSLVNKDSYAPLLPSLNIDATVSPKAVTVSSIMQHVRRGRIKAIHTIREGVVEVIEAEVSETSSVISKTVADIAAMEGIKLCSVLRNGETIVPDDTYVVRAKDRLILMAQRDFVGDVEGMFTVKVDLF